MKPDDITISGGRYWSSKLHGDAFPRKVGDLLKCDHGTYTATVDGRSGIVTIAADGWWFTELPARQPEARPPQGTPYPHEAQDSVVIMALNAEVTRLRGLLNEWLGIDDWEDDLIAPLHLVERTRLAVTTGSPLSPAKPGIPAATPATDPEAPAHAP